MRHTFRSKKIFQIQDKFDECKTHLDKAKKVLIVTHGGDHRIVTDTLESLFQQFKGFSTMMTNGSGMKPLS